MLSVAVISFLVLSANGLEDSKEKRSADPGVLSTGYDPGLAVAAAPISLAAPVPAFGLGGGSLVSQLVEVQNNVAFSQPVAVPHPVPVPLPVAVPQPVPVDVPVPVPVVKTVSVPFEKPVPYPVVRKVPVEVVRKVPVPVPQPYPVKVPVYKTRNIYYKLYPKHHSSW